MGLPRPCAVMRGNALITGDNMDWQWLINPLDGTTNFIHTIAQYAISIGLTYQGRLDNSLICTGFPFRAGQMDHLDAYLGIYRDLVVSKAGVRQPSTAALNLAWVASGHYDGFFAYGLGAWDIAAAYGDSGLV